VTADRDADAIRADASPLDAVQADAVRADPFFIVGTGRCGSTLLQGLLDAHPMLGVAPETQFFYTFDFPASGEPDPLPRDRVRPYLNALDEHDGFRFYECVPNARDRYRAFLEQGPRTSKEAFEFLLDLISPSTRPGVRRGEKSPGHWRSIDRIRAFYPGAKFIHLVRDPRDVVGSLMRMPWWEEPSVAGTARYWARTIDAARDADRRLGPDAHRIVRFEDLVAAPEDVLGSLFAFLGVPPCADLSDRDGSKIYRPYESSWKAESAGPVDPGAVARYRDDLTAKEIRAVERAAGRRRMSEFGYAPDPEHSSPSRHALDLIVDAGPRLAAYARRRARRVIRSIRKRLPRRTA